MVGNGFINGEYVKIADNSLTFTCGKDNNVTNHSYPRSSDPSSGRWLKISNVNCDQFDVQVLTDIPSTNTTVHTYVSSNASNVERSVVTIGGEYNHSFVSAAANGVQVGGNYTHTFADAKHNGLHRQSGKITVDVDVAQTTADMYDHTFVRALAGAVIGGGNYRHTFVSAETNGVIKANDYVMFDDFSLSYTCDLDKDVTPHT